MSWLEKNILSTIDKLSYEFFIVQPDPQKKCTCSSGGISRPDPGCKRCLGTGFKIRIKKIKGASVDGSFPETLRPTGQIMALRNYYIPMTEVIVKMDDIIVDRETVNIIYQKTDGCGFHKEPVYQKCLTVLKKLDSDVFLKNFNSIVRR